MPYTAALHASNQANASFFDTARKYAPRYDKLAMAGMEANSAERRQAMKSEESVRMAGMKAVSQVNQASNKIKAGLKKQFNLPES